MKMNLSNSGSTYEVVMLFNGAKYEVEGLKERVKEELESHNHEEVSVYAKLRDSSEHIDLTLQSSKKQTANSYKELFNNEDFKGDFITLVDEPGNEYRDRGYKKVSNVEQNLRAFLQQVLTDYIDFNWWEKTAPASVQEEVKEKYRASHNLGRLSFKGLIRVIEKPRRSKDKELTRGDLLNLLSNNHSIEDLKEKLKKEVETFSDAILPNYLGNGDTWEDLKSKVDKVIDFRNKIMHHRPFWAYELDELEDVSSEIMEILKNVSSPTEEETERITEEHKELVSETDNILEENINEQLTKLGAVAVEDISIKSGLEAGDWKKDLEPKDKLTVGDLEVSDVGTVGDLGVSDLGRNISLDNFDVGDSKSEEGTNHNSNDEDE